MKNIDRKYLGKFFNIKIRRDKIKIAKRPPIEFKLEECIYVFDAKTQSGLSRPCYLYIDHENVLHLNYLGIKDLKFMKMTCK